MIDLHTHILPNIDDGARNWEDTIMMLQEAEQAGFKKIVLTSHYMVPHYMASEKDRELLKNKAQQQTNLTLYQANEIYLVENLVSMLEAKEASTIAGTNYVLFELPFHTKPMFLYNAIYQMREKGYRPILAHPERYAFIQKEPTLVQDLLQKGVLMQGNFGSWVGQYGKKAQILIERLLEAKQIQLFGTDSHRPQGIYGRVPQILAQLEKRFGKEMVEELTRKNPEKVLENKAIQMEEETEIHLSFWDKWRLQNKF